MADSADDLYCGRFREKRVLCGPPSVVEERITAEIEETLQFFGDSSLLGLPRLVPVSYLSHSADLLDEQQR